MKWLNTGSQTKSEGEATRFVQEVIMADDFNRDDLNGFNAHHENQHADKAQVSDDASAYLAQFCTTSVDIELPSGQKGIPPSIFSVPNFHYRPLLSVIKEAFTGPLAEKIHFSPFRLFHQPNDTSDEVRVHGEMYTSDSFLEMHESVQRLPLAAEDVGCKRERTIAALMLWSDATHLANFGTAKLWPIYLMLGNISKYIRAQPESGACHHLAYIPSLPDAFQDFAKEKHAKWKTQKTSILTHCRRELMHAVWKLLLDDEFIHAYKFGVVIKCADGEERRVYPRFFTYSADYPEKVLLATIRDKGLCPCPRCLVNKDKLDLMGQVRDMAMRVDHVRTYLAAKVKSARHLIYKLGLPITSKRVDDLLKDTSSVPTKNAFVDRLGPDFDISKLLVVDFLHEFELGVWKSLFTHLVRLLYASPRVEKTTLFI
ncbi:hypothetical protein C8R42DRAFT_699992 [Lentinula raphanica]|nr:hypothetical protein C8R42DRAFT_699992 [Lentinula raphanica]